MSAREDRTDMLFGQPHFRLLLASEPMPLAEGGPFSYLRL